MNDKPINKAALQIAAGMRRLERADKYLSKQDGWASCCLWEALMQAREALVYVRRVQNGYKKLYVKEKCNCNGGRN